MFLEVRELCHPNNFFNSSGASTGKVGDIVRHFNWLVVTGGN